MLVWTGRPFVSIPTLSVYLHVPPTPVEVSNPTPWNVPGLAARWRKAANPAAPQPITPTRITIWYLKKYSNKP